jgi:hypothetical protein
MEKQLYFIRKPGRNNDSMEKSILIHNYIELLNYLRLHSVTSSQFQ